MKNKLSIVIYNFGAAILLSLWGTILLGWPILLVMMIAQRTNKLIHLSLFGALKNYSQLMSYLINPVSDKLQMSDLQSSLNGLIHFKDCKNLFSIALMLGCIWLFIFLYFEIWKKKKIVSLPHSYTICLLLLPLIVVPFSMGNFTNLFILFHRAIFTNNNWLFNPDTDPIILILTEEFFAACSATFLLIYELYFVRLLIKKGR